MTDVIDVTAVTDSTDGDGATPTPSPFDRLGDVYGIAGAVDVLADRLCENASANQDPHVQALHSQGGHAGSEHLVTTWSIDGTGGPTCCPGRDTRESHAHLQVCEHDVDVVAAEIAATLHHVGVPRQEHGEFMAIIESYRSMVVGPPVPQTPGA